MGCVYVGRAGQGLSNVGFSGVPGQWGACNSTWACGYVIPCDLFVPSMCVRVCVCICVRVCGVGVGVGGP